MPTTFQAKIESGNEAFSDGNAQAEVARILTSLAHKIAGAAADDGSGILMDFNGNRVGLWFLEVEEEGEDET